MASDLKENHLHSIISGFYVGDTPGIGTFYDFHKRLWLSENNNLSDSKHDLPVFPFLSPASRHDSHGFLYNWFSMKQMLPDAVVKNLLLDSAHDAMPYYNYCKLNGITPFIDLNWKCGRPPVYKDDISINSAGIPLCPSGHAMKLAAIEPKKGRVKYRCSKISFNGSWNIMQELQLNVVINVRRLIIN